jgi:molybdate transport system ATP-binding protein
MTTNRRSTVLPDLTARLGVLLYDTSLEVDGILAAAVQLIRERGIAVSGTLQHFGERLPNGKRSMWVEDIVSGVTIRLDQPRGPGATACMLDPDALAQAACMLRQATASGAELVVVSRFGNAEADGRGMRAELAEAICSGAAVLVAARFSLLTDLEGFLGAPAPLLLPSPAAIAAWAEGVIASREPAWRSPQISTAEIA